MISGLDGTTASPHSGGLGDCETKVHENRDFTGNTYGPVFATDYVDATMNDGTSAVRA